MKRFLLAVVVLSGCGHLVKVDPVTIQPIHITVDVNLKDGNRTGESPTGELKPQ